MCCTRDYTNGHGNVALMVEVQRWDVPAITEIYNQKRLNTLSILYYIPYTSRLDIHLIVYIMIKIMIYKNVYHI